MKTSRIVTLAALGAGTLWAARTWLDRSRRFDVSGKLVLITGGSRGLGLVLARELGMRGARIVICARDIDELMRAESELRDRNITVRTEQCDVTSDSEVRAMLDRIKASEGDLDLLINNAAIIMSAPNETLDQGDYDRAMEVNFRAPLRMMLNVIPEFRRLGRGRIVNISSFGGELSVPHLVPYCASKHALTGLSTGLRAELQREGILVTTVSPGMIRTGSHLHAEFKGNHAAEQALFSLGNANPMISVSAEYAARKIIHALERGRAVCTIGWSSHLVGRARALFPETTSEALAFTSRLLPRASGAHRTEARTGAESASILSPSPLTVLSDRAATRNNETVAGAPGS